MSSARSARTQSETKLYEPTIGHQIICKYIICNIYSELIT